MAKSCDGCKHWSKGVHWEEDFYENLGSCKKIAKYGPATSHSLHAEDIHAEIEETDDRIVGLAKSPEGCHLVTGSAFACKHWEPKAD